MPQSIQPPIVVQFNASSAPVPQISLSSDALSEQQLYDYGNYRIRQQLAPIPAITLPTPAGGKYRQIMVDIDPTKLVAKGTDTAGRREHGQRAKPDVAGRYGKARQNAVCRPHQCNTPNNR
jgi:multidrug efflux pump subunit AcrB